MILSTEFGYQSYQQSVSVPSIWYWYSTDPYPSLLILLVSSSQRLLVSTKMMVLFSFSLIISSSNRISLKEGGQGRKLRQKF